MHQTRLQRFTSVLKAFKREVIQSYSKYAGAFVTHIIPGKESDDLHKAAGLVLDGWLIDTHHLRWGIDAILECKVEQDFINENAYNFIQFCKKEKSDRFKHYREITSDYDSQLWKNADQNSAPLYVESISKNSRVSIVDPYIYPFRPFSKESLLSHMQRIRYFIHETPAEDYYNRLARQLFSDLTYDLFVGVDFSEKEKTFFMQEKHLMIPKEKTWKPLNILPGRFPIDKELCCKFILLGIDKFISSQNPIYAETLLYIWFAQATARWKRRGFEVNEIFTICPQQFRTIPITHKTFQANEHKVLLGNKKHFPISLSLKKIAFAYADTRSLERPIIKMHPSSIATCLKELAEELHLNPKTSPITLETFLEASHPVIGHRPGIKNSQKNTPSTT